MSGRNYNGSVKHFPVKGKAESSNKIESPGNVQSEFNDHLKSFIKQKGTITETEPRLKEEEKDG